MSGPRCQAHEGRCRGAAVTVRIIRNAPRLACRNDSGPTGTQWYGPAPGVDAAELSEALLAEWAAAERAHQRDLRRHLQETEAALAASYARARAIEARRRRQPMMEMEGA